MDMLDKELLEGGIKKDGNSYAFLAEGARIVYPFSSLADTVTLRLSGEASGKVSLTLFGLTSGGDELLLQRLCLFSEFSHTLEIDPPNLAVYRGVESFMLVFSGAIGTSLRLLSLKAEELENEASEYASGSLGSVPRSFTAPSSMLVSGNSLVFGMKMEHGMCATAADKDYYHYVTEYVKRKNPLAVFKKLYISMFEACEDMDAVYRWFSEDANAYTGEPSENSFTPDLDLITLQLGDNVNTEEKIATFEKSGDVLIEKIKERCPRARIILVHGWYNRPRVYDRIVALAEKYSLERIFIGDIRNTETECHNDDVFRTRDGSLLPISDRWRTHPGDLGMKRIADRIIESLGF